MKIKNLIVFLIAASFFMTLFYAENVRGAIANINIENWDSYNIGDTSGINTLCSFKRMTGGQFYVSNDYSTSSPYQLYVGSGGDGTNEQGYVNLTQKYSYIKNISLAFTLEDTGINSAANWQIYFYNLSNVIVLRFRYYMINPDTFSYYDSLGNPQTICSLSDGVKHYYTLVITHLTGNTMNYSMYDRVTGNLVGGATGSTAVTDDWFNFSYIKFSHAIGSSGFRANIWLDDFNISSDSTYTGSISTGDMTGYTSVCSGGASVFMQVPNTVEMERTVGWCPICWKEKYIESIDNKYIEAQFISPVSRTIYAADLFVSTEQLTQVSDSTSNYFLSVNGISWGNPDFILPEGSGYKIRWINTWGTILSNALPTFEFYSVATSSTNRHWEGIGINPSFSWLTSTYHGIDSYYGNGLIDGYSMPQGDIALCYWYNNSISGTACSECPSWLPSYTAKFGNDFIQFLYYNEGCHYGLDYNTRPIIIYNLSATYLETNSRCFIMEMYKVGNASAVYWKNIDIPDSDTFIQNIEECTDYTFTEIGQYYIKLYNTSNFCSNKETIVGNGGNPSMTIAVCDKTSNPPSSSGDNIGGIGTFDFSGLPDFFKLIAALFIIIVLTITPYALALLLSKGNIQVQMPSLIYVAFFFIGVVASIMLGFLDSWVIIIILIGLIITFAILWLQGRNTQGA